MFPRDTLDALEAERQEFTALELADSPRRPLVAPAFGATLDVKSPGHTFGDVHLALEALGALCAAHWPGDNRTADTTKYH